MSSTSKSRWRSSVACMAASAAPLGVVCAWSRSDSPRAATIGSTSPTSTRFARRTRRRSGPTRHAGNRAHLQGIEVSLPARRAADPQAHIVETLLLGAVITLLVSRRLLLSRAGTIATHAVQDARAALGGDLCRRRAGNTRCRSAATEGIEGDCPAPRIDVAARGAGPESVAATAHRTRRTRCRMGMILCNSTR